MKAQHLSFVGLIAIILAMFIVDYFTRDEIAAAARATWRSFALDNGLEYEPGEKTLDFGDVEGILQGRVFHMWTFEASKDSPDTGTDTRTRVLLRPRGMPGGFDIYPREESLVGRKMESWSAGVASMLGAEIAPTVAIGDSIFDKDWIVRGFDADSVRSWIASSERRAAFAALQNEAHIDSVGQDLRWEGRGLSTRPEIDKIVSQLESYAERIERD